MKNILIIKHGAFGDFVQALGAMRAIRMHHMNDHITLMTTAPFEALVRAAGYVDDVYIDERPKWYRLRRWCEIKAWLNAGRYEWVYDLQNSERTQRYFGFLKKKPKWSGTAKRASHMTPKDDARKQMHVFDALKKQLALAEITDVRVDDLGWIEADVSGFNLPETYALVVPGSSPTRKQKRWGAKNYAQICNWLLERGIAPVLIGTKDEGDVCADILKDCPKAIDLSGKTSLFQIAVLGRGAKIAIGNDTGPLQMIGPTGCKTLGLYPGFSNPVRHGPLGANVRTIQHKSMADIRVAEVRTQLEEMLGIG